MITLKNLKWSNILSYQSLTSIELDKEPLIQLVGDNGAGKTTIPLIVQEILYGKNFKSIKKQDLVNRHSSKKGYSISLTFSKEKDNYEINLDRKTTIKLQLLKNGKNISSHKSLDTYKQISEIIGISDFKTFTQLVYQSSTGSLEFLTATDTNRKRFLINLLQLEKYLILHDLFKNAVRDKLSECSETEGKMTVTKGWIKKHETADLVIKDPRIIPDSSKQENILKEIRDLENQLNGIKKTNQKIVNNNQYITDLRELNFDPTIQLEKVDLTKFKKLDNDEIHVTIAIRNIEKELKNIQEGPSRCSKCGQPIPKVDSTTLKFELTQKLDECEQRLEKILEEHGILSGIDRTYNTWEKFRRDWEKLMLLVDEDIPKVTLSKSKLEHDIKTYQDIYNECKREYDVVISYNETVAAHNSKVKVITEQLKEYRINLTKLERLHSMLKEEGDHLEVLKRIFSTNGLVSYKIESSVKELERTINEYLSEFSYFQIYFILDKDKLNIQVIDAAGEESTVEGLSAGELSRVNIATVLAIRKIMASLTSTKINFLFLDEIVGVLDASGKEKLTELLLREDLNTFIVAHEFDHPLVPKLHIIKENNISRIEND